MLLKWVITKVEMPNVEVHEQRHSTVLTPHCHTVQLLLGGDVSE
jgi:hypothetical protein